MSSWVQVYCEKCGRLSFDLDTEIDKIINNPCMSCNYTGFIKIVPEEYVGEYGYGIIKNLQEEFYEKYVKSSPNFDQALWDRRVAYQALRQQWQREDSQSNVPKCPTCGSTKVERISMGKKLFGGAMFGLLSSDVRNSMHCRNCGAKW